MIEAEVRYEITRQRLETTVTLSRVEEYVSSIAVANAVVATKGDEEFIYEDPTVTNDEQLIDRS
jgi:hypothetical protein